MLKFVHPSLKLDKLVCKTICTLQVTRFENAYRNVGVCAPSLKIKNHVCKFVCTLEVTRLKTLPIRNARVCAHMVQIVKNMLLKPICTLDVFCMWHMQKLLSYLLACQCISSKQFMGMIFTHR
jgi:hypothetical protein